MADFKGQKDHLPYCGFLNSPSRWKAVYGGFFYEGKDFCRNYSFLTTGVWFSYKGKITFSTDLKSGTEVVLQYPEKPTTIWYLFFIISFFASFVESIFRHDITLLISDYFFQKYSDYKYLTVFITLFLVYLSGVIVRHAVELPAARALKKRLK